MRRRTSKTESNHQESQDVGSNGSASGSQDQEPIPPRNQAPSIASGKSRGDVDEGKNDDEVLFSGPVANTLSSMVEGVESQDEEADETEESPKACWDVF